jgi:hypothetical protein
MAMRRTIAELVTRFRVTGIEGIRSQVEGAANGIRASLQRLSQTPAMQGLRRGAEDAARALQKTSRAAGDVAKKAAEAARQLAGVAAKVAGAATALAGAGAAGLTAITKGQADRILEEGRLAAQIQLPIEDISAIGRIAGQTGVEMGDLTGVFGQFSEKIADGLSGNAEAFDTLGISLKDSRGRAKDFLTILEEVSRAQAKLTGAGRVKALADLFGGGDVPKIIELLNQLGSGGSIRSQIDGAKNRGGVTTEADLQIARDYRKATVSLGLSLEKLQLAVFRAFGPTVVQAITEFGKYIEANSGAIVQVISNVVNYSLTAFNDLVAGFTGGAIDGAASGWYNLGAAVSGVTAWVVELGTQLFNMISTGQNATGSFAWLNDVRDGFISFTDAVRSAWEWLGATYTALDEFVGAFGLDLGTTLLVLGVLNFTGALKLIGPALRLVVAALTSTWFLGAIQSFSAAIGLTGALGAIQTFITTGLGAMATALGPAGVAAVALAYFVGAVTGFYQLLANSPINGWMAGITDALAGVEQSFAAANEASEAGFSQDFGPNTTKEEAQRIRNERIRAGLPLGQAANVSTRPATGVTPTSQSSIGGSRDTYNLVVNAGGTKINTVAPRSEVDRAIRSGQLSMTRVF